jgi:hypothetical protein
MHTKKRKRTSRQKQSRRKQSIRRRSQKRRSQRRQSKIYGKSAKSLGPPVPSPAPAPPLIVSAEYPPDIQQLNDKIDLLAKIILMDVSQAMDGRLYGPNILSQFPDEWLQFYAAYLDITSLHIGEGGFWWQNSDPPRVDSFAPWEPGSALHEEYLARVSRETIKDFTKRRILNRPDHHVKLRMGPPGSGPLSDAPLVIDIDDTLTRWSLDGWGTEEGRARAAEGRRHPSKGELEAARAAGKGGRPQPTPLRWHG